MGLRGVPFVSKVWEGHEARLDQVLVLQATNETVLFVSANNAGKGRRSAGEHSAELGLGR
jgi:hypothetical protein